MSLRSKYILFATGILLVITGVFSYQHLRLQEKQITEDDRTRATLITEIIKNGLTTIMLEGRGDEIRNFIETQVVKGLESLRLYWPDGTIMFSSIPGETGKKVQGANFSGERDPKLSIRQRGDNPVYYIQIPIYNEKPCRKCHSDEPDVMSLLGVEISMEETFRKIGALREMTIFFYIITLFILSVSLALMTTVLVNKPIKNIINTMKKVEDGNLDLRFVTGRKDEIGSLAESLNSMLVKLGNMRQELESCHVDTMQRVEKMATIGELAAAIAHEIKNPLAGISGAIQVFAEDFSPNDPRKEIIKEVLGEIDRLDKAVRDLLSFARPPEPNFVKTPILPVVERATRLIGAQAKKQNVNIEIIAAEDIEFHVDPEQMQQVFLNVMINALHSMPGGGILTVMTYPKTDRGEAEISITDTGQGIRQEEILNIFKPFFTTKHGGTGLGLAISKNIVEKHGGALIVESQVGTGSKFRIILPLED